MQAQGALQWALPDGYKLQFEALANELYIGGVYVRLFLKNPTFPLHAPKVGRPAACSTTAEAEALDTGELARLRAGDGIDCTCVLIAVMNKHARNISLQLARPC